jgi:hypothetical protein
MSPFSSIVSLVSHALILGLPRISGSILSGLMPIASSEPVMASLHPILIEVRSVSLGLLFGLRLPLGTRLPAMT